jgi:hypothetical protein
VASYFVKHKDNSTVLFLCSCKPHLTRLISQMHSVIYHLSNEDNMHKEAVETAT